MADIEEIIAAEQKRLETVLRAAFEAGKLAARDDMLRVLSNDDPKYSAQTKATAGQDKRRERAPKGLPRKLVSRVLYDNHVIGGSTPQDIVDAAQTEDEKLVAIATIRSELRKGKSEGYYQVNGNYWELTDLAHRAFRNSGRIDVQPKFSAPPVLPEP